jgi:hypothetical protein
VWQEMKEEQQKALATHAADCSSSVAVVLDGQVCDHSPLCIFSIPPLDTSPLQQPIFRREMNADPQKHLVHLDRNKVKTATQFCGCLCFNAACAQMACALILNRVNCVILFCRMIDVISKRPNSP